MNELELPDLFTTAARATINERCASAFLHDVRGTMQALFSAFELLDRSARLGAANPTRVERACDLARRAISQHEKSTLDVLQLLTLQPSAATTVHLGELVNEVTHFLRNDAAVKAVTLAVTVASDVRVSVERARLQTLLIGLLTAAIDESDDGVELAISIELNDGDAIISIGSHSGFGGTRNIDDFLDRPRGSLRSRELTLLFARQFLAAAGGRLEVDADASPAGMVRIYYPAL